MSDSVPKVLYTLDDAAEALSVCRATVIQLVKQGYLRATKIGRLTRIHRSDVEKLAKIGVPSVWGCKPWPEERKKVAS